MVLGHIMQELQPNHLATIQYGKNHHIIFSKRYYKIMNKSTQLIYDIAVANTYNKTEYEETDEEIDDDTIIEIIDNFKTKKNIQ